MHNSCYEIGCLFWDNTCNCSFVCQSHSAKTIISYSSYNSSTPVAVTVENNKGIYGPTTGYNSENSSHYILINRVLPELEKNMSVQHFLETFLEGRPKK